MKYRSEEVAGIRRAREENPEMAQRKLAKTIYDGYSAYGVDGSRTTASVYGTLRRIDRTIAAEKAATKKNSKKAAAAA